MKVLLFFAVCVVVEILSTCKDWPSIETGCTNNDDGIWKELGKSHSSQSECRKLCTSELSSGCCVFSENAAYSCYFLEGAVAKNKGYGGGFGFATTCTIDGGDDGSVDDSNDGDCVDAPEKPNISPSISGYAWSHNGCWPSEIIQGHTDDVNGCAQRCNDYSGCVGFDRNNNGNCYVYTSATDLDDNEVKDRINDAYKKCPDCVDAPEKPNISPSISGYAWSHNGYWISGGDFQGHTDDVNGCAQKCNDYSWCLGFERNHHGKCKVYTSITYPIFNGRINDAYKKCPEDQSIEAGLHVDLDVCHVELDACHAELDAVHDNLDAFHADLNALWETKFGFVADENPANKADRRSLQLLSAVASGMTQESSGSFNSMMQNATVLVLGSVLGGFAVFMALNKQKNEEPEFLVGKI